MTRPAAGTRMVPESMEAASSPAASAGAGGQKLRAVVLTGSPRKHGTSFLLADEFVRGLRENGHQVERFDTAFMRVHPCCGCRECGLGEKPCRHRDDMGKIVPSLLAADLVAFVSPVYYYCLSAQIKAVIDRFLAIDRQLHVPKRAVLVVTLYNSEEWRMEGINRLYESMLRHFGWTDGGRLYGYRCWQRRDVETSEYPELAYRLGRKF